MSGRAGKKSRLDKLVNLLEGACPAMAVCMRSCKALLCLCKLHALRAVRMRAVQAMSDTQVDGDGNHITSPAHRMRGGHKACNQRAFADGGDAHTRHSAAQQIAKVALQSLEQLPSVLEQVRLSTGGC